MLVSSREEYYNQKYVIYEILKQLKYKYLSVRKANKNKAGKYILSTYYIQYS